MSTIEKRRKGKVSRQAGRVSLWDAYAVRAVEPSTYFRWKGGLDRLLAAILLVPALPLIGLLILMIRSTSRGAGIYRQTRVGEHGRQFTLYKLRSMKQHAEAATGAVWSQKNDPRLTRLGRVLRKLHLDELPQLVNVLKGEMSLVGPRPERPEFVHVLAEQIPGYLDRLAVLPGITGLAQVNLPPDTDLNSVRRKLGLDLEYVRRAGLFLDLRILLCTFARMLRLPGGLRFLGLRRTVPCVSQALSSRGGNGSASSAASPEHLLGGLLLARRKTAPESAETVAQVTVPIPDGLTVVPSRADRKS